MIALLGDGDALSVAGSEEIEALTRRATAATFRADGLDEEQVQAIERVNGMAVDCVRSAASNANQRLVVATCEDRFAGFVIATVHAENDRELDWLMVDPDFHGTGVANSLMDAGIAWLGEDRPIWLNVIRHNRRAIRFYERHGFAIDPEATTDHAIPHHIMRRGA